LGAEITVAVSVAGRVKRDPKFADVFPGRFIESAIPLLKVIKGEMIAHLAYKVTLDVVVTTPPSAIFVPRPSALVFHPAKV
jgi:hypothetical protein